MSRQRGLCSKSICIPVLASIVIVSCRNVPESGDGVVRLVQAVVVASRLLPHEVSGFGLLSYPRKVDIYSPQEGVLAELVFREGDSVLDGAVVARIKSPQLELSVGRACNVVEQAKAALALAEARLFEGRLSCESRSLGIEKSLLELEQACRKLKEAERKQGAQETLYEAGGVTEEAIRSGRFTIEAAREELDLLKKDIDIRLIGLRDEDLLAAGLHVPVEPSERQRALNELSTSSEKAEVDAARARIDAALKELASARLALSELTIVSPISGVIGARYMELGERVKRDDKLITLIDAASLYAICSIGEAEAIRLVRGMKASVFVDAAGRSFEGTLEYISPMADAQSASFSIRVSFIDPSFLARPGMFARILVTLASPDDAILIPRTAILDRRANQGRVFLLAGGIVMERSVHLGYELGEETLVLEGLEPGDVLIDSPNPGLKEGENAELYR